MTTGRLSLDGLTEYLEELVRAGEDIDAAAQRALDAGSKPILEEMQVLVPKDTHQLEEHLGVDGPHQYGNFSYVDIGVITGDTEIAIYGNVQEYGSARIEAHSYIRSSMKRRKATAMNAMKESLKADGAL